MIPKNLKIGDTFTDGGYRYKVVEIVPEGYISARITDADVKNKDLPVEEKAQPSHSEDEPEKVTSESVKYSKTQINRMPNSKLEEVCKELGLEAGTGTEMKRAIIAKLGL